MKTFSTNTTYGLSDGTRLNRSQIESRIRKAKEAKVAKMQLDHGYIFCESCGRNANAGEPIDCSHDEPVKVSLEEGRAEKSWDWENNIKMRCRRCHNRHDKTY